MAVGPAGPGRPPLVPSHLNVPPAGVVTWCPSVVTGPSNVVLRAPSTRTVTVAGAANAGAAHAVSRSSATGVARLIESVMEPSLPRGSRWHGRRQVSWLWAPRRAFPGSRRLPSGLDATPRRPITVAGPRRILTGLPFTTGRYERAQDTPTPGRVRSHSLQSPADGPPSSRGLGRRPLTAETGVRIPVAVPPNPAQERGFVVLGSRAATPSRTTRARRRRRTGSRSLRRCSRSGWSRDSRCCTGNRAVY